MAVFPEEDVRAFYFVPDNSNDLRGKIHDAYENFLFKLRKVEMVAKKRKSEDDTNVQSPKRICLNYDVDESEEIGEL